MAALLLSFAAACSTSTGLAERFYRDPATSGGTGAASEPLLYTSVAAMAKASTAVVVARVADVVAGRSIADEGGGRLHLIGVVLDPTETLRGRWPATANGRLTIEFVGGSAPPDDDIEELRKSLHAR